MKWRKLAFNPKANTHRAGWKFWDLVSDKNELLACVKFQPDHGYVIMHITDLDAGEYWETFRNAVFPTEKQAKDAVVAYLVKQKLEEYL